MYLKIYREVAVLLFVVSLCSPAATAFTGQVLFGFEMFLQGFVGLLMVPFALQESEYRDALRLGTWLANCAFYFAFKSSGLRQLLLVLLCLCLMMQYALQPLAMHNSSGLEALPVKLEWGFYLWVASAVALLPLHWLYNQLKFNTDK